MTGRDNYAWRIAWLVCIVLAVGATTQAAPTAIDFERRVEAQRAIEQVYWGERLWPGQGPKPPLSSVISDEAIRDRVGDYLRKSNALEVIWHRPVTGVELQAELDRMVRQTRSPQVLTKLFAALDDDPALIAETLVRQNLVDRLVRGWYAKDALLHADVRGQAARALAGSSSLESWVNQGATVTRHRWVQDRGDGNGSELTRTEELLDEATWAEQTALLAERVGSGLPVGVWSELGESAEGFDVVAVTVKEAGQIETTVVRWPKQGFDDWWAQESSAMAADVVASSGPYSTSSPEGGAGCVSDSWEYLTGVPAGRVAHTAVWTGSEMIVWGGGFGLTANSVSTNLGGRYDPATDSWSTVSTVGAPSARRQHTAVWTGNAMIVWGGREDGGASGDSASTGGVYDPATDSWSPTSTVGAPSGREDHTAVWLGGEMIVWGGANDAGSVFSSGGRYDAASDSWSATSSVDAPTARDRHVAVSGGSEMIVWGGQDLGNSYLATGAIYDPASDSWSPTTGTGAPSGRVAFTGLWSGNEMIVWGGYGPVPTNSGGRYDPASDSWSATAVPGSPDPRKYHTAVWTGDAMIVWGGDAGSVEFRTGGSYDPLTDSWSATSLAGPAARANHTAVWSGSEMIVWGGATKNTTQAIVYLDSGGRYAPDSDSWVSTPESGGPIRRAFHTAVWTGAEMVVWGGSYYGDGYLSSGGIFDPATSSWTSTSETNSPEGRRNLASVWTGTEMIVWGGYSVNETQGLTYHKDGGRYNLATHTWTPTSLTDAPIKRANHTVVWTGTEMIVWGGAGHSGFSVTHRRYDPATDTWTPMNSIGEPEKRYKHTAVWTGSRMLVWGGGSEALPKDSGGLYDPATDSWTATSMDGAPGRRLLQAAVWTGDKLIIWGGKSESTDLDDGAVYDPAADTWTAISTDGAPGARHNLGAVWTGSNMIVWGGRKNSTNELNSGGVYNPTANSWTSTTAAQTPDHRSEFTAVWTGTEMLVFGGEKHPNMFWGDGSRYCALDADGDGAIDNIDCDPGDASAWDPPGEVDGLVLAGSGMTAIVWDDPQDPGSMALQYDVLRSSVPSDFAGAVCVASDVSEPWASDGDIPGSGEVFFYLVNARNACGSTIGEGSDGAPRGGFVCN